MAQDLADDLDGEDNPYLTETFYRGPWQTMWLTLRNRCV